MGDWVKEVCWFVGKGLGFRVASVAVAVGMPQGMSCRHMAVVKVGAVRLGVFYVCTCVMLVQGLVKCAAK